MFAVKLSKVLPSSLVYKRLSSFCTYKLDVQYCAECKIVRSSTVPPVRNFRVCLVTTMSPGLRGFSKESFNSRASSKSPT